MTFLEVTPKRGLYFWEKICRQKLHKNFFGNLGKFGENLSHPKNLPARTPMMKRHLHLRCPLLKGQRNKMPHSSASMCMLVYRRSLHSLCRLQLTTLMDVNYQRYQRQQFITAKISGKALKQRSRTHSVLHRCSSQLQKYKAARMSCRIAVDQKVCRWDGRHSGLTVWNL